MNAMTQSRWDVGTYEMHIMKVEADEDGDMLLTVFARAISGDDADDKDAPILAQVDFFALDVDLDPDDLPEWMDRKSFLVGEKGLEPEWFELVYGQEMALLMNQALLQAITHDLWGVDSEGAPWRTPSFDQVLNIRTRTRDAVESLQKRLGRH